MKKEINKLVRDKIPSIITSSKKKCKTEILSDERYLEELDKKLLEEVHEYLESGDTEELADIQEVLLAILNAKNITSEQFEIIRASKAEERGAFSNKIYLISVEDN